MSTLSVVCWKWGSLFSARYVNRLRNMLERHLHVPHVLHCVTDDERGIDYRVRCLPMPRTDPFRCRRRMWQFSRDRAKDFGDRMLCVDLDMVIVDDITSLVQRDEPYVFWRVAYARVLSGSFMLFTPGALHKLWEAYERAPEQYASRTGLHNASDQAMLNYYLRDQLRERKVPLWHESDGILPFFGIGYEQFGGIHARTTKLPPGTRIVVLGSADKPIMERGALPWIEQHWR